MPSRIRTQVPTHCDSATPLLPAHGGIGPRDPNNASNLPDARASARAPMLASLLSAHMPEGNQKQVGDWPFAAPRPLPQRDGRGGDDVVLGEQPSERRSPDRAPLDPATALQTGRHRDARARERSRSTAGVGRDLFIFALFLIQALVACTLWPGWTPSPKSATSLSGRLSPSCSYRPRVLRSGHQPKPR